MKPLAVWVFWLCLVTGSQGVRIFPASQGVKIEETLSVTLPCVLQTSCPDSRQITWYKGKPGIGQRVLSVNTAGKVLVNSNYTGRVRLEGQAGLVIISPYLSDAGNYSCEALITVDIPPIASAYVYLNVSPKKNLTAPLVSETGCLVLGILATVAFLGGLTQLIARGRQLVSDSPLGHVALSMDLLWIGLCLVSATILWIRYSLRNDALYRGCIGTAGLVTSVIGLTVCSCCQLRRVLACCRRRPGNSHNCTENTPGTRPSEEPMLTSRPHVIARVAVGQSPVTLPPIVTAWNLEEETFSTC